MEALNLNTIQICKVGGLMKMNEDKAIFLSELKRSNRPTKTDAVLQNR